MSRYDGFAWYRCFVKVPKNWEGQALVLKLGGSGRMPPRVKTAWQTPRRCTVAPEHVRFGGYNVIADNADSEAVEKARRDRGGPSQRPHWAQWPASPDSPEGEKVAQQHQEASGSAVGAPPTPLTGEADPPEGAWTLWYRRPAQEWVEALPIGNGRLGAMVFGRINKDRIQLNEDSLWSGKPIERDKPDAAQYLAEARRLLFEGKYAEGQELVQQRIMGLRVERGMHTYQMLGDLELSFEPQTEISDSSGRPLG